MATITALLVILGLCAGSFINALVWRLYKQSDSKKTAEKHKYSILKGRSMCTDCQHTLAWYDLLPVISWLWLKGRCRYCKKPISWQYPLVELLTAIVFAGSYIFWPDNLHVNGGWILLATWLVASVGLIALAVYDLRWMLLPSKIIYPSLAVAVIGRAAYIIGYQHRYLHSLLLWAGSLAIASGVFWLMFMISKGKWIGYGDVRLGLVTGTLLARPDLSLLMIFLGSLIGSLVALPGLANHQRSLSSKLPYGPFLIAGTAIAIVFGASIIHWYKNLLGLNSL